jgi:hypothetical protein
MYIYIYIYTYIHNLIIHMMSLFAPCRTETGICHAVILAMSFAS